ncbi:MAG: hypothetical protein KC501_06105 [Myxococcales bacterium]|nr:hypothetical protein [Myxococcales bacterium]
MAGWRLTLRDALGLGLVAGSIAAAPPAPRPAPPPSLTETHDGSALDLHPRADGSLEHVDRKAHFTGIIRPDGRAQLEDRPAIEPLVDDPRRVAQFLRDLGDAIARPGGPDPPSPPADPHTPDPYDPRGRLDAATDRSPPGAGSLGPAPIMLGVGVRMGGLADMLLRRGQRRHTKAKQAFLEQTAPMRDQMARDHEQRRQRTAMLQLGRELSTVWRDPARSAAERRRALFLLWDDCEELARDEGDDGRREGGEQMRRRIEAFIRRVAPPGSDDAFDPLELSRLNRSRHSRQRFDPYAAPRADPLELAPTPVEDPERDRSSHPQ